MDSFVDIPEPSKFIISELFSHNNFVVPLYQRNYAWEKNEILDFWDDLLDIVTENRNSHFFGQIVTYKNKQGNQEIIDGQQRLTTSTIFMSVIRDIANQLYSDNFKGAKNDDDLDAGDILRDIRREVEKSIRGQNGSTSSLTVQHNSKNEDQDIQAFFYRLTHGNVASRTEKTSSEPKLNMQSAYNDMNKWVNGYLKNYKELNERITKLQLLFDSFVGKFYIVMISAPSLQDAFTIFETLNSRGKDLKASDIIKNHLMSLMGNDIKEGNEEWSELTDKLDNDSDRITRFIRTYWAAKKHIVPESKLYREVSSEINSTNSAQSFLNDLDKLVVLYTVLESPLSPKKHYQFFDNKLVTENIDILSHLNVKLYYPVVMAMYYKKYNDGDILKAINKIISVFIRHRTIINNGTNKLETGFSDVARKIWNLELKNVNDIMNELNDKLLPSKEATQASFTVLEKAGGQRGAKKWTLVYLLSELYGFVYDDFEEGIYSRVFNDDDYRLVQISTDDSIGDHQNFIGNWIILEKNLSKSDFKDTDDLVKKLSSSRLKGNQELAQSIKDSGWTKESIEERQKAFSTAAITIW